MLLNILSGLLVMAIPFAFVIAAGAIYGVFATHAPSPILKTPKWVNKFGNVLFWIGYGSLFVAIFGPMFRNHLKPTPEILFYLTYVCTTLVAFGTYFKDFKRSDSSKSIKLSKIFGHLLLAIGMFLLFQFIVYCIILQDTGERWAFVLLSAIVITAISALLLFNAYKKKTLKANQSSTQSTSFDVVDTKKKDTHSRVRSSIYTDGIDIIIRNPEKKQIEKQEKENIVERTNDDTHQEKTEKTHRPNKLSIRIKNIHSLVKNNLKLVLATAAVSSVITLAIVKFPWNNDYNKVYIYKDSYTRIFHSTLDCDRIVHFDSDLWKKVDISDVQGRQPCQFCCNDPYPYWE